MPRKKKEPVELEELGEAPASTRTVKQTPTDEYPMPYNTAEEEVTTFEEKLAVAAATGEVLKKLGAPVEVDLSTLDQEKELIEQAVKQKKTQHLTNLPTALGASAFLQSYAQALSHDATQIRSALTNKLLELADCGDPRYELRAIELLGKHSDVGLFTERSEININYNSPEALESAILERVNRLMKSDIIDLAPLGMNLDEELGVYAKDEMEEAEFNEVEREEEEGEADE